jgi:purine-binding chemotaxis protein CheW
MGGTSISNAVLKQNGQLVEVEKQRECRGGRPGQGRVGGTVMSVAQQDGRGVGTSSEQVVVLNLGDEQYGVDIGRVQEIIRPQVITRVPHTPAFVEGIINLRGRVIPVIDLCARFGLPRREQTKETRIAVSDVAGVTVGLVVDGVSEVLRIDRACIEPPSPIVAGVDSSFIRGIAKLDGRLVILLEVDRILSREEHGALASERQ